MIPKYSAEDTVLTAANASGERVPVPVPKGMEVYIHTPGLHYNRMSSFGRQCEIAGSVMSLDLQQSTGTTRILLNHQDSLEIGHGTRSYLSVEG